MLFTRTLMKIAYPSFKLTPSMALTENELEVFVCISVEMYLEVCAYGNENLLSPYSSSHLCYRILFYGIIKCHLISNCKFACSKFCLLCLIISSCTSEKNHLKGCDLLVEFHSCPLAAHTEFSVINSHLHYSLSNWHTGFQTCIVMQ